MLKWIPLNSVTAPDEIEENTYLIYAGDRIVSATHDAMNKWFYYEGEGYEVVYPYRLISHYAEFNLPDVTLNARF